MSRLPQPGSDKGTWGDILNDFLGQAHNADGTIKQTALDSQIDAKIAAQAATDAAQYLKLGGTSINGSRGAPYLEFDNDSTQASLHLVAATGFSGPYVLGIGVNADNSKGAVVDVTNPGATGLQANLLSGAGTNSVAVDIQINDGIDDGIAINAASYGATGIIERLHAAGTPAAWQKMVLWQTDALAGTGGFGADLLRVYADTGIVDVTSPELRKNGGYLVVQDEDVPNSNSVNLQRQHGDVHEFYAWTGTTNEYWTGRIHGTGNFGGVVLDVSTGPYPIDSEVWAEALRTQNVGGAPGISFFGAAAVNQPVGTPAAATDLASAVALVNALRADLINFGLIA